MYSMSGTSSYQHSTIKGIEYKIVFKGAGGKVARAAITVDGHDAEIIIVEHVPSWFSRGTAYDRLRPFCATPEAYQAQHQTKQQLLNEWQITVKQDAKKSYMQEIRADKLNVHYFVLYKNPAILTYLPLQLAPPTDATATQIQQQLLRDLTMSGGYFVEIQTARTLLEHDLLLNQPEYGATNKIDKLLSQSYYLSALKRSHLFYRSRYLDCFADLASEKLLWLIASPALLKLTQAQFKQLIHNHVAFKNHLKLVALIELTPPSELDPNAQEQLLNAQIELLQQTGLPIPTLKQLVPQPITRQTLNTSLLAQFSSRQHLINWSQQVIAAKQASTANDQTTLKATPHTPDPCDPIAAPQALMSDHYNGHFGSSSESKTHRQSISLRQDHLTGFKKFEFTRQALTPDANKETLAIYFTNQSLAKLEDFETISKAVAAENKDNYPNDNKVHVDTILHDSLMQIKAGPRFGGSRKHIFIGKETYQQVSSNTEKLLNEWQIQTFYNQPKNRYLKRITHANGAPTCLMYYNNPDLLQHIALTEAYLQDPKHLSQCAQQLHWLSFFGCFFPELQAAKQLHKLGLNLTLGEALLAQLPDLNQALSCSTQGKIEFFDLLVKLHDKKLSKFFAASALGKLSYAGLKALAKNLDTLATYLQGLEATQNRTLKPMQALQWQRDKLALTRELSQVGIELAQLCPDRLPELSLNNLITQVQVTNMVPSNNRLRLTG